MKMGKKSFVQTTLAATMLLSASAQAQSDNLFTTVRNSAQIAGSSTDGSAINAVVSAPESEFSNLPHFMLGDRSQRVRFLLSGKEENLQLVSEGEGYSKVSTDRSRYSPRDYIYIFYAISDSSATMGQTTHPEILKNGKVGMIAQPSLMMCYTDLLKKVVETAKNAKVAQAIKNFRIDEINLFLKPVLNEKLMKRQEADAIIAREKSLKEQIDQLEKSYSAKTPRFDELRRWLRSVSPDREKPQGYEAAKAEFDALSTELTTIQANLTAVRSELSGLNNSGKLLLAKRIISKNDTVLEISRVSTQKLDPALNLQVPFVTNTYNTDEQCVLPTSKEIAEAIVKLDRQQSGEPEVQIETRTQQSPGASPATGNIQQRR